MIVLVYWEIVQEFIFYLLFACMKTSILLEFEWSCGHGQNRVYIRKAGLGETFDDPNFSVEFPLVFLVFVKTGGEVASVSFAYFIPT